MTPSEQLAGKVRRRVRRLGYRSWWGWPSGVSVAVHDIDVPAVRVETRGIPFDEVSALRMALVDHRPRGYVAFTVGEAFGYGRMVDTGVASWWFVVTAELA